MSDLFSNLYLFKNRDPSMQRYCKPGVEMIFFDVPACKGEHTANAISVRGINKAFEQNIDEVGLLKRMVWMMDYLQEGYHTGDYPGPAGEYDHARTEYPQKYKALVIGLSDKTIETIRTGDFSDPSGQIPSDVGTRFIERLLVDREALALDRAAGLPAIQHVNLETPEFT